MTTALYTEEYWRNSQLSIAAYYGGCIINKETYKIVNKNGITVEELSDPDSPHFVGEDNPKAIPEGEPCDLINVAWIPVYKKLGRDRIIKLLQQGKTLQEVERLIVEEAK